MFQIVVEYWNQQELLNKESLGRQRRRTEVHRYAYKKGGDTPLTWPSDNNCSHRHRRAEFIWQERNLDQGKPSPPCWTGKWRPTRSREV